MWSIRPDRSSSPFALEFRATPPAKHGFRRAIVPKANVPKTDVGLELIAVTRLVEALGALDRRL